MSGFVIPGVNQAQLDKIKTESESKPNQKKSSGNGRPSPKNRDYTSVINRISESTVTELKDASENTVSEDSDTDNHIDVKTITLKSGAEIDFYRVFIPHEKLKESVVVTNSNKRKQALLSRNNTYKLAQSLRQEGQLYDCYGELLPDKRISNWDGSRRFFSALDAGIGLWFLVTKENSILESDKKNLITKFHLYEPPSIIDNGYEYLELQQTGKYSHAEIAELFDVSRSNVTKSILATEIPTYIVALFQVTNELSFRDLSLLRTISSKLNKQEDDLESFIGDMDLQPGTSKKEIFNFLSEAVIKDAEDSGKEPSSNGNVPTFKLINKKEFSYQINLTQLTDDKKIKLEAFLAELNLID
ncbi:hypothetical protein HNW13_018485 [Shewanella sp. BF02_Schw]|uniref:hypothetical protein n=1 Tax=Shewanella sp. BF02_Schw TaxID=394908 RepID=UPI00177FEE8F|nr:hypothetical protein [Shewanella sp. BF02_Schw]MBO1897729.1 hypothetical protein [Shewanella sp. BF02_Schw]